MAIHNNSEQAKGNFRQGDVFVFRKDKVNDPDLEKRSVAETIPTLALGEATGHHHSLLDPMAATCFAEKPKALARVIKTNKAVGLGHQEHETIPLPADQTFVTYRQMEYTPAALVNVRD
jgi:hypothetical protein